MKSLLVFGLCFVLMVALHVQQAAADDEDEQETRRRLQSLSVHLVEDRDDDDDDSSLPPGSGRSRYSKLREEDDDDDDNSNFNRQRAVSQLDILSNDLDLLTSKYHGRGTLKVSYLPPKHKRSGYARGVHNLGSLNFKYVEPTGSSLNDDPAALTSPLALLDLSQYRDSTSKLPLYQQLGRLALERNKNQQPYQLNNYQDSRFDNNNYQDANAYNNLNSNYRSDYPQYQSAHSNQNYYQDPLNRHSNSNNNYYLPDSSGRLDTFHNYLSPYSSKSPSLSSLYRAPDNLNNRDLADNNQNFLSASSYLRQPDDDDDDDDDDDKK